MRSDDTVRYLPDNTGRYLPKTQQSRPPSPPPPPPTIIGTKSIDPRAENYASQVNAAIYRNEWEDYLSRFAPYEDKLMSQVGNEEVKNDLLGKATNNVTQSFGLAEQANKDRMAAYGIQETGAEKIAHDKNTALAKTAATVGARNSIRTQLRDTENRILAGGLSDTLQRKQEMAG